MNRKIILSIDLGTTGNRVFCFDQTGTPLSSAYKELTQIFPQPGWVEHDPLEILNAIFQLIPEALSSGNLDAKDIISIGITNQRETTILWNKHTGKPVHNAIVWQCRRSSDICQNLKDKGFSDTVQQKTGLVLDPYFSATKITWLLRNIPGLSFDCADGNILFGTVDSWILWHLTGKKTHATDMTNASRTLLYNIKDKKWDDELLRIFDIPSSILPDVFPSVHCFGTTLHAPCLPDGIVIGGIAGDQQAAMVGQRCTAPGTSKSTYGTGCFLLLNTGNSMILSNKGLLTTITPDDRGNPVYALEGSVFIGGAVIQWLRDQMHFLKQSSDAGNISSNVKSDDDVVFVPAFSGLGAPYWDMNVRGAIFGLTRDTSPENIVRAANKAIALQSSELINAMCSDASNSISILKADGKAADDAFLMQYQSDILGIPVQVPSFVESTALGAAYLAMIGAGLYSSISEIPENKNELKEYRPMMKADEKEHELFKWKTAIQSLTSKRA
jgi:glycerol kinase